MIAPNGIASRPIEGFPGYFIGADGSVWSARTKGRGRALLRPPEQWVRIRTSRRKDGSRYVVVCFRATPGGPICNRYVHRLVLEAFVGPCPDGMECRHFPDRSTDNNRLENLAWGTHAQNLEDTFSHGTRQRKKPYTPRPRRQARQKPPGPGYLKGASHHSAKLSEADVLEIRQLAAEGVLLCLIAAKFSMSRTRISAIVNGRGWKHLPL